LEAIVLHYDGIKAMMAGVGSTGTTEEDVWRFLLDKGWLEKHRNGESVKQQWLDDIIKRYKGKPLVKEGGMFSQFFRGSSTGTDNSHNSSDSRYGENQRWSYIYFKGQFRYLKHKYIPTSGILIDSTFDNPIKNAVIRVRCYWNGNVGNRWSFRTETNEYGNFLAVLSWEVPQDTPIYAET
jgi:hypothetical protein